MNFVSDTLRQACGRCESTGLHVLTRRWISNGAIQYVYQCSHCGGASRNPVSKDRIRDVKKLPDFDLSIAEAYAGKHAADRAAERQAWFAEHDAYLQSNEWKKRRRLVMERAGGICEGCRSAKAVHVHHLTYAHWKRELLWELVAVCVPCHEAAHDEGGK